MQFNFNFKQSWCRAPDLLNITNSSHPSKVWTVNFKYARTVSHWARRLMRYRCQTELSSPEFMIPNKWRARHHPCTECCSINNDVLMRSSGEVLRYLLETLRKHNKADTGEESSYFATSCIAFRGLSRNHLKNHETHQN